jgi:cytochrome c
MLKQKILMSVVLAAGFYTGLVEHVAAEDGATLYKIKTCWACHGKDAKTPIMPVYPKIAGQNADYAYNQMVDIKSGARSNGQSAAMKGVMHLVSDEEMRIIADWLSTL